MILGLTCIGDELFVLHLRDNDQVEVYTTKLSLDYNLLRQFSLEGLQTHQENDMTSCGRHGYLFISDFAKSCLYKSTSNNGFVTDTWYVPESPVAVSLTPTNNVLVTCSGREPSSSSVESCKIIELACGDGERLREVSLPDIGCPSHAVQLRLSKQRYVVTQQGDDLSRVCVIDADGQVLQSYGREPGSGDKLLNRPRHVTVDRDNFIFVADRYNNRVVLLSPKLQLTRQCKFDKKPWRLYLDHVTRRLYVGLVDGDITVMQV